VNSEEVKLSESLASSAPEPPKACRSTLPPVPARAPALSVLPGPVLPEALIEQILDRLGFGRRPEPTIGFLRQLYGEWCRRVPFDNVRKLIHLAAGPFGPLPGGAPEDFFRGWLKHGAGGTCWAGAGALQALLKALGFDAERVIGTMLVTPDLPPNHGTVIVNFEKGRYLVDSSILHGEPLRLEIEAPTSVWHPAWGVRCALHHGQWHVHWRALQKLEGLECRLDVAGVEQEDFAARYEQTRGWGPFNYEVAARLNRGQEVIGLASGHAVILHADGTHTREPLPPAERRAFLIEEIGLSEEIVAQLPNDRPTPPPPWSRTAQNGAGPSP